MLEAKFSFGTVFTSNRFYVIGGSSSHVLSTCEYFDFSSKAWKAIAAMRSHREEHGVVLGPDNKIYSIGGFDGKYSVNTAESYDPKANLWAYITSLKVKRQGLSTVVHGNDIYAIGGRNGEKFTNTVEKYNPRLNEWKIIKEMNVPRAYACAVSAGNYIYVLGGHNGKPLNVVEKLDVLNNTWTFVHPMRLKRHMHCAILYPNRNSEDYKV